MLLSLRYSKTVSFFLSIVFSVTEVSPSKRFSSVWIAMSVFSIFIHQNTKSTTILCIYNILEERLKVPSKIFLIDVDSAYHQEVKRIKFIHLLINCGETPQGRPNSLLKWRPRDLSRTPVWKYITKHITVVFLLCEILKNWLLHIHTVLDNLPVDISKHSEKKSIE